MIITNFNEMSIPEIEAIHEKLNFDFVIHDGKVVDVRQTARREYESCDSDRNTTLCKREHINS